MGIAGGARIESSIVLIAWGFDVIILHLQSATVTHFLSPVQQRFMIDAAALCLVISITRLLTTHMGELRLTRKLEYTLRSRFVTHAPSTPNAHVSPQPDQPLAS